MEAILSIGILLVVGLTTAQNVVQVTNPVPPGTPLLIRRCKAALAMNDTSEPSAVEALGIGFCFGVMDGLRGANLFLKKADLNKAFYEPSTIDNGGLAAAFVKGVEANPKLLELRGALAAQLAFIAAFPCKTSKR